MTEALDVERLAEAQAAVDLNLAPDNPTRKAWREAPTQLDDARKVAAEYARLSPASDEGRDGAPFFPPEADDEPVTPQAIAGLLILHAEAVHGCQHTADFRDVIGMDGPRGVPVVCDSRP